MIQPFFGQSKPRIRRRRLSPLYCTLVVATCSPNIWAGAPARADIQNWQTHATIPGTAGITPGPSVVLDNLSLDHAALGTLNLTSASFSSAVVTNAQFQSSNLTGAAFTNANLAGAFLSNATLSGAILNGATVSGASFANVMGLSLPQLYSTSSYTMHNMQNIVLSSLDLHGGNFSSQNLFHANFQSGNLASTTFAGANLGSSNLSHANLTNASLAGTSLAFANLASATFTGATLNNADITGAVLTSVIGLTAAQFSTTANYQAQNLQGIAFSFDDLTNWNLAHQNLAQANLQFAIFTSADLNHASLAQATLSSASLTSANLSSADLTSSNFFSANASNANFTGAALANTNFTCADLRGAAGFAPVGTTITDNAILPDGTVPILHLAAGQTLTVRYSAIPVSVTNPGQIDSGTVMQINASQVTFNQPLTINGTLNVANAGQVTNLAAPASGNGSINVAAGSTLTFPQPTQITVSLDITGQGGISQTGTGTTTLTGNYAASGPVSISAGKLIFGVTPAPRQTAGVVLNLQSLTLSNLAVMDITNHDVLIGNGDMTAVNNAIRAGMNGGNITTGPAILSSTAAPDKVLVPVDSSVYGGVGGALDGLTITQPNSIIIKYTYAGDVNLDGAVTPDDYVTLNTHFGQTTPGLADIAASYAVGDFNLDGIVSPDDYVTLNTNFGKGVGGPLGTLAPLSSSPVPEPASLLFTACSALILIVRRRDSHC